MGHLFGHYLAPLAFLKDSVIWPGLRELWSFISTHLLSELIPSFFLAGAVAVFIDRRRIVRLIGPQTSPLVAYPVAVVLGSLLTSCACGVVPVFAGLMWRGAGIGPACAFLISAPALNLVFLDSALSLVGPRFYGASCLFVILAATAAGQGMKNLFENDASPSADSPGLLHSEGHPETLPGSIPREGLPAPIWTLTPLFCLLLLIMLTTSGVFDRFLRPEGFAANSAYLSSGDIRALDFLMAKLLMIVTQLILLGVVLWAWFPWPKIRQWLAESLALCLLILPRFLLGIFLAGILGSFVSPSDPRLMAAFESNSVVGNFLAAIIGTLMYFESVVGVKVVATLIRFGMPPGPAMTLTLAGPSVSIPSVLAITGVIGLRRAVAFVSLVVIITALSGWIYGTLF